MTLLEVRAVTHGRRDGGAPVLDGVSLSAGEGRVTALVGRSGSGKSTLCGLVAGLDRPDRGEVLVQGRAAGDIQDWAVVAYQPQRLGLPEELAVRECVSLPAWVRGAEPPADLLERLGLAAVAERSSGSTSLGEQQRAGIARALVLRPRLVVLDEPTGHQDDARVDLVLAAVVDAARAGSAVLVATHDPRVVAVADEVVGLEGGRVTPPRGRR